MPNSWQTLFFVIILLSSISVIPLTSASVSIDKTYLSPKKQVAYGVSPANVVCLDGLVLMKKLSDNSPACVKPDTAQKLVERGWGSWMVSTTWFELTPIQCHSPWDEYWHKSPLANTTIAFTKEMVINFYFKNNGITLLEARELAFNNLGRPPPMCGQLSDVTYYFLAPQNNASKMVELGFKATNEKEVQDSGAFVINITNTEQKVWFEFVPIQCQTTPWDKLFENVMIAATEKGKILTYFAKQGITIFDARYFTLMTAREIMPHCGNPSEETLYFLVSESDSYKMTSLGYKKLTTPLPPNPPPIPSIMPPEFQHPFKTPKDSTEPKIIEKPILN